MDSKRLVPVLHVLEGRVVDPADGADRGSPAVQARLLELEGADEILFVERGRRLRQGWVVEAARTLFIPFALEATFRDAADLAGALDEGAGRVVVPARDLAALEAFRVGRAKISAALEVAGSPAHGWDEALERMRALDGAGELLLTAAGGDLAGLCARAAHLATPIILRCSDPAQAMEALVHGADGIAYPAALLTPASFKDLLEPAGIPVRR